VGVTEIGATARIEAGEPDGTILVTVRPWWSRTPVEPGGAPIVRAPLDVILVRVRGYPNAFSQDQLRVDVEAEVRAHDTWTKVVADEEFDRLWRGIEWETR
jgi:hypothetical protein